MTREEAIQVFQDKIDNRPLFKDEREAFDMAIEALQTDVVRCKDCRYRNGKVNSKGFEVCDATEMDITDEDFCSWGERREP